MYKNRFLFLQWTLRFDNTDDRDEGKNEDPNAAVSMIFDKFNKNSQLVYSPGPIIWIHEMLVTF